jgi:hypothetical protein
MDSTTRRSDPHGHCAELIPWLVNGTASGAAAAAARAHLAECAACQADYAEQARLCEETRAESPVLFAAEASLQKLMTRVDSAERGGLGDILDPTLSSQDAESAPDERRERASAVRSDPRARAARSVQWLAAAVVVEAIGLGIVTWLWHTGTPNRSEQASYYVLGDPDPDYGRGAHVRVVFEPGLALSDMQKLLHSVGAHIVDGPTEASVYTLGFAKPVGSGSELSARLQTLRASPSVRFAEPASRDSIP